MTSLFRNSLCLLASLDRRDSLGLLLNLLWRALWSRLSSDCILLSRIAAFAASARLLRPVANLASLVPVPVAAIWKLESVPLVGTRESIDDDPLAAQLWRAVLLLFRLEEVRWDWGEVTGSRQEWA